MVVMRRRPEVPGFALPKRRERTAWRWLSGSVFTHALILFLAIFEWPTNLDIPDSLAPGGEGPRGGGGFCNLTVRVGDKEYELTRETGFLADRRYKDPHGSPEIRARETAAAEADRRGPDGRGD